MSDTAPGRAPQPRTWPASRSCCTRGRPRYYTHMTTISPAAIATETMSPAAIRAAFSGELDYYRRAVPGTDTSRKAATAVVRALDAHPWLHDQIPCSVAVMARREALGLSPVG